VGGERERKIVSWCAGLLGIRDCGEWEVREAKLILSLAPDATLLTQFTYVAFMCSTLFFIAHFYFLLYLERDFLHRYESQPI
jgi:hypothetical protein